MQQLITKIALNQINHNQILETHFGKRQIFTERVNKLKQ